MNQPLGVMSVLLLEAAAGGAVVLWASGVWGVVRRGFFLLTGNTVALSAWGAWLTARAGLRGALEAGVNGGLGVPASGAPARAAMGALLAFALLLTLWQALLLARADRASRPVGLAAAALGLVAIVLVGLARGQRPFLAILELLLGSLFLGSTLVGLLLGHWYLVERRLSNVYMVRSAWWYCLGVVAAVASAALSAANPLPQATGFSPFLSVPGFTLYLAGGLVAICALIAGFVWKLAHEGGRSIQAATGMFYLAVILAFSAELSSKFRFF